MEERNSTIEYIRILSMVGIIGLHYFNYDLGGALNTSLPFNYYLSHFIESVLIIAPNIFFLLTGYYMATTKTVNVKKLIEIHLVMSFYGFLGCIAGCIINGISSFSFTDLFYSIFPFFNGDGYWFFETYFILVLFAPFINIILTRLNKKTFLVLVSMQLLLFCLWPTFLPGAPIKDAGYGIINAITMYFIAAYVRLQIKSDELKKNRHLSIIGFFICCFLTFGKSISHYSFLKHAMWHYCSVFNVLGASFIFVFFISGKARNIKIVNKIASCMMGVFFVTADSHLQEFYWQYLLKTNKFWDSYWMVIHFIVSVLILMSIGLCIELLRKLIWRNIDNKMAILRIFNFVIEVENCR